MNDLITQLLIFGYDVFVPLDSQSAELVISCSLFTKRCYYRPSKRTASRGLTVNFELQRFTSSTTVIDAVVTYDKLHSVIWLIPMEDAVDVRMMCLSNKAQYELQSLVDLNQAESDMSRELIKTEREIVNEAKKETEFYTNLLKGKQL